MSWKSKHRAILTIVTIVILCSCFATCKKDKEIELVTHQIEESNIGFNNTTLNVITLKQLDVFKSNNTYTSYFSSAGFPINDSVILLVSTRAFSDDDYEKSTMVKKYLINGVELTTEEEFKVIESELGEGSPSLMKVNNRLLMFYGRQHTFEVADVALTQSNDSGNSWLGSSKVTAENGFYVFTNDRALQLSNGRIIIPLTVTTSAKIDYAGQRIVCYYSDDNGTTWKSTPKIISTTPLMEPSIVEVKPGHLLMVIRSITGKLLFTSSSDNGITWSNILKSKIDAPVSTSALYNIGGGKIVLIWNHNTPSSHVADRTPLSISVSSDEGNSWSLPYTLANTPGETYTSPALIQTSKGFWILYNRCTYGVRYDKVAQLVQFY